jgi:hypothetical protein
MSEALLQELLDTNAIPRQTPAASLDSPRLSGRWIRADVVYAAAR